jgi:CHAT domain-containing protein/tetratricopeptide (TPR) repeat protein
MFATLILGIALVGQHRTHPPQRPRHALALSGQKQPLADQILDRDGDFQQPPVTLHRSISLDQVDLEIRRQHTVVQDKKRVLGAAVRLARQGAIDPGEMEQAVAEYRFHAAQESERKACRALEVDERDIQEGTRIPDDARTFGLLREWLQCREAMAEAKAGSRAVRLAHEEELYRRHGIGYWDVVEARLELEEARAEVALSRTQQEWSDQGQAAWTGAGACDPERRARCLAALRQAGVRCSEARIARDGLLLDMVRVALRSPRPLPSVTPPALVLLLKVARDDALASFAAERRRLAELDLEKADPQDYALAMRRSIEADDLDRAIRRQHHEVLLAKAHLDTSQRLAARGAICPAELDEAIARLRYLEATEGERVACQALIAQDRDTRGWAIPPDGEREYSLRIDWAKRKLDMARVKADFYASRLARDRKLFGCKVIGEADWAVSCRAVEAVRAEVAMREGGLAELSWKLAVLTGEAPVDPAELLRLRIAGVRASVRYFEANTAWGKSRLVRSEVMFRQTLLTGIELQRRRETCDDSEAALTVARQRLDVIETRQEHDPEFVRALEQLASFLHDRSDFESAKTLYERALALRGAPPGDDPPGYARSLAGLAKVYVARGHLMAAERLLLGAVGIINRSALGAEHPSLAEDLRLLAVIYRSMGDTRQAESLLLRGLEIRKKVYGDKHPSYASGLGDLVVTYCADGDYGRAEPLAYRAAEMLKATVGESHPYFAMGLHRLAWVRGLKGDYDGAGPLLRKVLELREPGPGRSPLAYAETLRALAWVEQGKGNFADAESLYQRALEIQGRILDPAHPDCSLVLRGLAGLYHRMGDHARAGSVLVRALEIDRKSVELASAGQSESQQLRMVGKLRSGLDLYLSLPPGAPSGCDRVYREVLAWKGSVFARQQARRLARNRPGADAETGRLSERLDRITSRLASLVFSTEDLRDDRSWRHQVQQLTAEKVWLEKELARHSSTFARRRTMWRLTPAGLQAALPPGVALVDLLEYRHEEPPPQREGKMCVERRVVAFVVRADRPIERIELGPAAAVAAAVDRWRAAWVEDGPPAAAGSGDPAVELRRLVWAPLERSLEGTRAVLISPDGALARFPLAALPGRRAGTFLIEDLPIALVPVPQLLPRSKAEIVGLADAPGSHSSLLVLGDIDFGGAGGLASPTGAALAGPDAIRAGRLRQFQPLPGTARELREVCTTFHQTHPTAAADEVRGAEATEAALRRRAPGKHYLHLATHGFFAPSELSSAFQRPARTTDAPGGPTSAPGPGEPSPRTDGVIGFHPGLLSGLALAGANDDAGPAAEMPTPDDGILTALEVAELDLSRAELVTLSGCETGLGREAGGEGLLGLQRAFQVAGARTVVASLWKVSDEATQQLMSDFYFQLWHRNLAPIEALRQAQLHMLNGSGTTGPVRSVGAPEPGPAAPRRARAHPRLWAAWVVSGDPGVR